MTLMRAENTEKRRHGSDGNFEPFRDVLHVRFIVFHCTNSYI